MKTALALCGLLLLPSQLTAATRFKENVSNIIDWSVKKTWSIKAAPVDFAMSFDKKKVFVLEKDNKVHVYSIAGKRRGTVPVGSDTVAIVVPSRKKTLHLVGRDKGYKAIRLSLF